MLHHRAHLVLVRPPQLGHGARLVHRLPAVAVDGTGRTGEQYVYLGFLGLAVHDARGMKLPVDAAAPGTLVVEDDTHVANTIVRLWRGAGYLGRYTILSVRLGDSAPRPGAADAVEEALICAVWLFGDCLAKEEGGAEGRKKIPRTEPTAFFCARQKGKSRKFKTTKSIFGRDTTRIRRRGQATLGDGTKGEGGRSCGVGHGEQLRAGQLGPENAH